MKKNLRQLLNDRLQRIVSLEFATVAGASALAAFLSLLFLGRDSLWLDETFTAYRAQLSWHSFVQVAYVAKPVMPAYLTLIHLWTFLGSSEFVLRLPSAIAFTLTVPALYNLAKRLFGWQVGVCASLLFATHPSALRYAQEARGYSLAILLIAVSSIYLVASLEKPSWRNLALYCGTSVIAIGVHLAAAGPIAAQWFPTVPKLRDALGWRVVTGVFLTIGLAAVILTALVLRANALSARHAPQFAAIGSVLSGSILTFSEKDLLLASASRVAGELGENAAKDSIGAALELGYALAFAAALASFIVAVFRGSTDKVFGYGLVLSAVVIPIAAAYVPSPIRPMLLPRYFVLCLPFLVMAAAAAICEPRSKWIWLAALVCLLSVGLAEDGSYYAHFRKEEWRQAIAYILANAQPADGVISTEAPYEYYQGQLGWRKPYPVLLQFGAPAKRNATWGGPQARVPMRCRYRRIWLLMRTGRGGDVRQEPFFFRLVRLYDQRNTTDFRGLRVAEFDLRDLTGCPPPEAGAGGPGPRDHPQSASDANHP